MSRLICGALARTRSASASLQHPAFAESPKASSPALDLRHEIRVAVAHVMRMEPARVQPPVPARDSVKNGVILGAIIGGAYGAVGAAFNDPELPTSGKVFVLWTSAAVGAGIGWLTDWLT